MPPLARLRVSALDDLARQLRYASPDALARDIAGAERLAGELEPDQLYNEAWIIERITGHAVDLDEPSTVVGHALRSDLSAFVERLSAIAKQTLDDLGPGALHASELAERWSVSRKTIDRYRRQGLIAHRVLDERGRSTLAFTIASVERFEREREAELAKAGEFTRIDPDLEERLPDPPRRYRLRLGWSPSKIASRLGNRFDRSAEAVRQLLQRHDDRAGPSEPRIFERSGEIGPRERRLAHRAVEIRGLEPQIVARRLGSTTAAARRAVAHRRLALLRQLDLTGPIAPWSGDLTAERKALSLTPARTGLGRPLPTNLIELVELMRAAPPPIGAVELARLPAIHVLRSRAAAVASSIRAPVPPVALLDRAEADLLWASRLKAELVRDQLGTIRRAIEQRAGRPIDSLGASDATRAIRIAIAACSTTIDRFNPFSGERRLAAPVLLSIDAALASSTLARTAEAGKATPALPSSATIADPFRSLDHWQRWLEPMAAVSDYARTHDSDPALLLRAHFGLCPCDTDDAIATPPMSIEQIAAGREASRIAVGRSIRKAIRVARAPAD